MKQFRVVEKEVIVLGERIAEVLAKIPSRTNLVGGEGVRVQTVSGSVMVIGEVKPRPIVLVVDKKAAKKSV